MTNVFLLLAAVLLSAPAAAQAPDFAGDEIREKLHALQLGAKDYVTKPFDIDALLRRVGDVVRAPATKDQA